LNVCSRRRACCFLLMMRKAIVRRMRIPRTMRRIVHQGRTVVVGAMETKEGAATTTREERQTPNPSTTSGHPAATQDPCLRIIEGPQLMQSPAPPPEQLSHPAAQAAHDPFVVSKYSFAEHVDTHVEDLERTGRVEGHERQVSKVGPQVSQSGWQGRQVGLLGAWK
jgi:hypothetical protein